LERCRRFLAENNPRAAERAARAIERNLALLDTAPDIGRPVAPLPRLRELVIGFGDSGYVALYRYVADEDVAYVLAFRHQKEAGY
jgi:plasmid stabilization system protein ParE